MTISADDTGYFIVKEGTVGATPQNAAWDPLPIVSESLATNATTTISNSLNPQRQVVDSVLTGLDVSGSIECEFARTPAMDIIMESALANVWDKLTNAPDWLMHVLNTKLTFSIMKRWPDGAGGYVYQIYSGCTVNTLALTMSAGAEVTASIGIVGEKADADRNTVAPGNYTINNLASFNVLRAPEVQDIVLDNEGGTLVTELAGQCTTDMVLNLNANVRGIQCLGTLGNKSVVLGRFEVALDMTIFFNDNNIMEEFLEQNILNASFTVGDDNGDEFYKFTVPRGKISSETVVAGGTGTDVVNQLTLQGLVDTSLDPDTSLVVGSRDYGANAPTFVSGVVENAAPTEVVITFSENVAITDSTGITINVAGSGATINNQVAAGSAITFTLAAPVAAGEVVTFQADATNTITDTTDGLSLNAMDTAESVTNNVT